MAGSTGAPTARAAAADTTPPTVTLVTPSDGDYVYNGLLTYVPYAGAAGTDIGDLPAVTVEVYSGSTASGTPVQTLTTEASAGAWSVNATTPLAGGTYTARAQQSDEAGNVGYSDAHTFIIGIRPNLSITAPAENSATTDPTPTFSGTAGDAPGDSTTITVNILRASDDSPAESLTATRSGSSWSVDATTPLADGDYIVQATETSTGGDKSATSHFTVDTVAPSVGIFDPADGTVFTTATPVFDGLAGTAPGDEPVTVKVWAGIGVVGSPVVTQTVQGCICMFWTARLYTPLSDGTYTVRAEQADRAGNVGYSDTRSFTIHTHVPAVTLAQPADGSATSDPRPPLSGTLGTTADDLPAVDVDVFIGNTTAGSPLETIAADVSGGSWSARPPLALPDGWYTVVARQKDTFGATGHSAAQAFRVDTTAPFVRLTDPGGVLPSGTVPVFRGASGYAPGDIPRVTIEVFSGPNVSGTPSEVLTADVPTGSTYAVAAPAALDAGTYTARASQRDDVDNVGYSLPLTFTVATPSSPPPPPPPPPNHDGTPPLLTGLSVGKVTISYRLSEAATVSFAFQHAKPGARRGGRCVAAPQPKGSGTRCTRWVAVRGTLTHASGAGKVAFRFAHRVGGRKLARGRYTVTATPRDAAGNVGRPVLSHFAVSR